MNDAADNAAGRAPRLSVAPMLDRTDRHFRYLARCFTRHTLLYTEMVVARALLCARPERFLGFDAVEHPLALQLAGSEPRELARAARIGADAGFDEINLNVGCPSDRVQSGRFGACLMAEPGRVAECVAEMRAATGIPVTVKTRIGIDQRDSFEELCAFVETVAGAGCGTFIVHARKAWLNGLSPTQNRSVPPLRYDVVYALKRRFPELRVVLNGGVNSLDEAARHLEQVDGVMIGRAAYADTAMLAEADARFFGAAPAPIARQDVLAQYLRYCGTQCASGTPWSILARPALALFHSRPGARAWRLRLSQAAGDAAGLLRFLEATT